MSGGWVKSTLSRFAGDYGMLLVLLLLCMYYSWVTYDEQHPTGADAGRQLAQQVVKRFGDDVSVLIVARSNKEDLAFADTLRASLDERGVKVVDTVTGEPIDARAALDKMGRTAKLDVIGCNRVTADWKIFEEFDRKFPKLSGAVVVTPTSYWWPNFLKRANLLNIANQIVVIAILAIGMTMVIITAGIDLSVGSLIALSACVTGLLIRDVAGAEQASAFGMMMSCVGGVAVCGVVGLFSGVMVTVFAIPPFITTLAMMLVASGLAYILAEGQSIYQIPESFVWLGRGADLLSIPNAVVLMVVLYAVAHVLMTQIPLGRYIYAVGGNREAARLSGVPVRRVLLFVYTVCGALAGLGGVVMASQLKSGSPTYGLMYELYTIAAVVVGGTSLSGGEGKILGTLIGAFIIAVIQNGMNLTGVESYTQKVVLGLVILGAVLLDMLKRQGWRVLRGATG